MHTAPETEHKYIIKYPDVAALSEREGFAESEILQIYLLSSPGVTHRIRRRRFADGREVLTETEKRRLSPLTAAESERAITPEEFATLEKLADPAATPVEKRRITLPFGGRVLEIDIYPQWKRTAILEIEMPDEDAIPPIPPFLTVLREVSGDRVYSNAAMSRHFPPEII